MSEFYKLVNKVAVPTEDATEAFDQENKRVASDTVGESNISTVFLGMNYGWEGEILLFETMVFGGKLDQELDRYRTWEEAELGHKNMVERVKQLS